MCEMEESGQMKYRHEWKHEITYGDMLVLRQRLSLVAKRDLHTVNGNYEIRSLYFDTPSDKALREKTDGVNIREKFRIRCYNGDLSFIRLEKKSKVNGLCLKESAPLTVNQAEAVLNGAYHALLCDGSALLAEFYSKIKGGGLRPKTIVDYTREPFVYAPGNVRITLDYHIRSGLWNLDFLNPDSMTVSAGNNAVILEVKWDEYLPDIIKDIVQVEHCRAGAFSKYAACRIYG